MDNIVEQIIVKKPTQENKDLAQLPVQPEQKVLYNGPLFVTQSQVLKHNGEQNPIVVYRDKSFISLKKPKTFMRKNDIAIIFSKHVKYQDYAQGLSQQFTSHKVPLQFIEDHANTSYKNHMKVNSNNNYEFRGKNINVFSMSSSQAVTNKTLQDNKTVFFTPSLHDKVVKFDAHNSDIYIERNKGNLVHWKNDDLAYLTNVFLSKAKRAYKNIQKNNYQGSLNNPSHYSRPQRQWFAQQQQNNVFGASLSSSR